jgi:hypothetical protein
MNDFNNLKFISEDDKEFVILKNKTINGEYYGYAANLNDESDTYFVKILKDEQGFFFEKIDDPNIMKEIIQ